MKALIIILAIVGLSFVGLLIYGGSGSQEPKRACQKLPAPDKDGDVDVPDSWCPPSLAKATRSLQARFAPGLDLPDPGTALIKVGPQLEGGFDVPPIADRNKRRTAKLTLVSGTGAIVRLGDSRQCLCEPGTPVPALLRSDPCSSDWREEHERKGWICQSAGKWGTIPVEWTGGHLTVDKGPPAEVEVK